MTVTRVWRALALYLLMLAVILPFGLLFEKSSINQTIFTQMNSQTLTIGDSVFWAWITSLGDTSVAVVLIWLILPKNTKTLVKLTFALILGGGVSPLIKNYFDYPRPLAVLGDSVFVVGPALHTHAFVSGHTITAFLLASLVFLTYKTKWAWAAVLIATLVGVSRVMVGAHWPADVLCGALVGWGAGAVVCVIAETISGKADKVFGVIGIILFLICLFYLALGKMANIQPVITFWKGCSVLILFSLFVSQSPIRKFK